MALEEAPEVIGIWARHDENEGHMARRVHTNRQGIGEQANTPRCARAEVGMRERFGGARRCHREVCDLIGDRREPCKLWMRDDRIKDHQALRHTGSGDRFPVPAVGLADCPIQRCVTHVVDPRAVVAHSRSGPPSWR